MKKEFIDSNWLLLINKIRMFIDEYNLELISIELKKQDKVYIAKVQYDLGIRK